MIEKLREIWPKSLCRATVKIMQAVADELGHEAYVLATPEQIEKLLEVARRRMLNNAALYLAEVKREDSKVKALHNWIADGDWRTTYEAADVNWLGKDVRLPDGRVGHCHMATVDKLTVAVDGENVDAKPGEVELA